MDEYRPDVRMGLYLVVFPAAAVGLAAVLPLLQYFGTQVDEAVSIPGGTRLPGANPFWWVAFGLTVLAVTVAWRRGLHGLAASAIILVGFGLVLVAGLVIASGATWTDMGYYPTKTLATVALVATPFAVAGGAWALHRAFLALLRRRGHSTVLVAALSVAVLAAGVSLVAVAAERQPLVIADWIDDGPRRVPYGLPVLTELKARGVTTEVPGEPVIALGVAPYDSETAWLGDWNSMDATGWLGHGSDPTGDVVNAVVRGTASDICETLADHPGAPRITGPTDASGIEPLLDSGCPEAIVRPDDWIRVTIPDEWFALLPQQGQPYDTEFPEAWGER